MTSQLITYASHVVPLAVLWLAIVLEWLPLLQYGPDCSCFRHVVFYAPVYSVICLGVSLAFLFYKGWKIPYYVTKTVKTRFSIYALFSVCYGVATFNDCAQARSELIQEIKEARSDLKKRNIIS